MKIDFEFYQWMVECCCVGYEKKQVVVIQEKGLLIVYIGNGKGKSMVVFGMVVCVFGYGMWFGVVQFIKGVLYMFECDFFGVVVECDFVMMGDGYMWNIQNCDVDIVIVCKGWDEVCWMIESGDYWMVIFDELNIVFKYEYLLFDEVFVMFVVCLELVYVVVIGWYVFDVLIDVVDFVIEMWFVKYLYKE